MANSRTIEFKGHFDGKQVLDELKKIRQNMADAGADDNLFKGIDKDIAATEKLVTEMMAQIQKGFSNTKEVNAFEKQIDKLQTNLLKISSGMQNVNIVENLGLNSPEITSLTKELEQLTAAQDHLKEVSKEALDQAKKSVGLRDDEIAKIKEAIDANEDLEEALKKVGKAKEKRFLSQAGEAGMQTQAGKDYIKNADAGLSLSDLGVKASSGNTAKAKNDARKRYDDGELYGNANNRQLDEVKAAAAVTEAYQKTLEKMITSGGNAAEAVEEMKKALADYGVEIENTDKLQENFYNDIEGFYKSPAVERGNKGNITKARKIGRTNVQGEYELSDASTQNFLNNSNVTAYADNMRRATEVTNQLGQEIEEATRRTAELVNENDVGLNNAIQNTNNMTDATREGAEATREASESAEKMNNTFDDMKSAVKTFLSIGSAVSALKNVVRDTFNDIKELDKSFANIAMVTDYSVQKMWSSYDQYAEMANKLGQSTQSVIQASGLFYQQGLDTADSLALTEDTMKLATLAGLDFAEATSQMTAALRGFHMEMDEGGRVTDVYSELAAKAAADVEGIAYAMSKTASIASSAGMEFETTSAFLTQMIETTQEAPENIGTAMKTIIARFTELKENVAGTADSEFEDLDYNKVDTALKSVGVSIKDASGQFRDLDDVFLELSQKWNTLDRNSQRYIATIAAGSRQQSRFIAMMENYDRTMELVDTAYDSAGKSSEQFAKYQDTVEYKMNQLQNSWEQFRTQFFNSSFFKTILDNLNKLLKKITQLSGKDILGIATVWLTLGKNVIQNFIKGIQSGLNGIQKIITTALSKIKIKPIQFLKMKLGLDSSDAQNKIEVLKQEAEDLKTIRMKMISDNTDVMNDLKAIEQKMQEMGTSDFSAAARELNMDETRAGEAQNLRGSLDANTRSAQENAADQKIQQQRIQRQQAFGQAAGQAFSTAFVAASTAYITSNDPGEIFKTTILATLSGLIPAVTGVFATMGVSASAAFTATGVGAIVVAIGLAIAGLAAGLKALTKHIQEQAEKQAAANSTVYAASKEIERLTEKQEKLKEALQKSTEEMEKAKESYEGIIEGEKKFQEYSEKTLLSVEEKQEFLAVQQDIAESYPELISYYDQEGNAILTKLGGAWDAVIEKKKEYYEKENLEYSQDEVNVRLNELLIKQSELLRAESIGPELESGFIQALTGLSNANAFGSDVLYKYNKETGGFYETSSTAATIGKVVTLGSVDLDKMAQLFTGSGFDPDSWKGPTAVGVLNALSESEKEQYGTLISQALEMVDSSIKIDRGAEGIDDLMSYLNSGNEGEEQDKWNTIKDDLEAAKELSLSSFKIAQQEAEEAFNNSLESMVSASAMTTDIYNDSSENVQKLMDKYIIKEKNINFDSAVEDIKRSHSDWFDDNTGNILPKYIDDFNKTLEETFDDDFLEEQGFSKEDLQGLLEQTFDEKTRQNLEDFYERTITKNGDSFVAQVKDMQSLDIDQSVKETWLETQSEFITAINERFSYIASVLGEKATRINQETGEVELGGLYSTMISDFSDVAVETLSANAESMNQSDFKEYMQLISSFSPDYQEELSQIDLSSGSYLELLNSTEAFTAKMVEQGKSAAEAATIYNSFISKASELMSKTFFNTEQIQVFRENIDENLKNLPEDYSLLLKAQQEFQEKSELSSETFYALREAGFDEYVQTTAKGYQLLSEKVSDFYNQKALAPYEEYKKQIKTQEQTLSVINSGQTVETKVTRGYNGNTSFEIVEERTLKEAAEYYKENQNELKNYEGAYKDVIQAFIDSEDDWQTFIKNLKEVNNELKNQESEVYIQSLHTITDAYEEASDAVEDLKDKLTDLQDQEKKDKKSKDEAYKAWQEAIHGTKDYQSSLDGLLNYERRLESFNNKLEDTKEALSDISNINDAKNLLEQTTSLYEGKLGTLKAESKIINQSLENLDKEIMTNYANFVSLDDFGNMNVDISALESADMSDILKDDGFTQLLEKRNEMYDKARETDQAYLDTVKEWEEQYKTARESEIKMEETIINILKEKMQEEVDTVKEKYSALEEADNNYLDALQEAIDKQRKLREQENQYEDLATKQKKLSLMQRDTSGANQKEVQQLEKEVKDDQQNLLDSEVDNLIESMQELYEKQKEARDLEIEAMEAETENMQAINETAMTIMAGFQSVEDYQAWLLENDKTVEDMTATQTEQYLDEAKETFSGYAQYVALTAEDMQLRADEINKQADLVFENTNENVSNIGTTIQELAVAAADKAEEEAKEVYDDAVEKMNETQKKITETEEKLAAAEANAASLHQSTMDALVEASQSGMADVAEFAISELAALTGLDLGGDPEKVRSFLDELNLVTDEGGISQGVYNAIASAGGDTSQYTVTNARYSLEAVSSSGLSTVGQFATKEAAEAEKQRRISEGSTSEYVISKTDFSGNIISDDHGIKWPDGSVSEYSSEYEAKNAIERIKASTPSNANDGKIKSWATKGDYEIFKTGGLVNYTGPAWVDGTPTKPEAFLNAQDTQRIGEAAKILAQIPALNGASENVSTNIGDTTIEIHINVESIESDYDVDQMIERVKNDILDVSKPTGTSVILKK